ASPTLALARRRRRHRSPLFPYTTLFRSQCGVARRRGAPAARDGRREEQRRDARLSDRALAQGASREARRVRGLDDRGPDHGVARSEEHTSELQSRENLVCRLLLEKKKKA